MIANAAESVMEKVLVIDDERGPRESLRILLKNDFTVVLTDGVNAGVEAIGRERPDIVVMDIRMPGKTGIEGLREIRAIDPYVTVVMLTGFGTLETAQQAIRLGANDYIKKPFDTQEMTETIRAGIQRTHMERRRAHVSEELRQLNSELVDELTVKEHMATLGHASSELVHDLRNPLTVVHGYAQLLAEQLQSVESKLGESSSETFEYLDVIEQNVQRCYEITEMWRNLGCSQSSSSKTTLVASIIHDVMKGIEPFALSSGASVQCHIEEETFQIMADGLQIFRALQNLVQNALHALPENGGRVEVRCEAVDPETLAVDVIDNGCGMNEEQLERIFEPYYTTKGPQKGTGLGLAIAKKVIENHGGAILVESEPDVGTRFRVTFPLIPASTD